MTEMSAFSFVIGLLGLLAFGPAAMIMSVFLWREMEASEKQMAYAPTSLTDRQLRAEESSARGAGWGILERVPSGTGPQTHVRER